MTTTTAMRKLVVTSLVTGIVQADGLLGGLPLPLWASQFAHAGIELAFIGSSSALLYEAGAYAWKTATRPAAAAAPAPDGALKAVAEALGARIIELETRLAKLDATASAPPTVAGATSATTPQAPKPAPSAAGPKGQRLQPGSNSLASVLAEVSG
ncbi:MAG: hypothetical protein JRN45_00505 [Nitrososphaerota archaeon]|nr:hypothetical protein [Nitrososphaerota archaeon]